MGRRLGLVPKSRLQLECNQRILPQSVTKIEALIAFMSGFIERILMEKEAAKTVIKAITHKSHRSKDRNLFKQLRNLILSHKIRVNFLLEFFYFETWNPCAVWICIGVSTSKQPHIKTFDRCLIGMASELMGTILVELRQKSIKPLGDHFLNLVPLVHNCNCNR